MNEPLGPVTWCPDCQPTAHPGTHSSSTTTCSHTHNSGTQESCKRVSEGPSLTTQGHVSERDWKSPFMMLWSHFEAISLSLIWLNTQLSQPVSHKTAWNSLYSQGWPWTHGNPPNVSTKDCLWELPCLAEISYITLGLSLLAVPWLIHLVLWHWWQKILLCFPVLQTVLQ